MSLPIHLFATSTECWTDKRIKAYKWTAFYGAFYLHREKRDVLFFLPGRSEDLSRVGTYGVDRAVVTPDLSYWGEVVNVPHLEHAAPTCAQQHGPPWDVRQSTHPVLVGVGDLLQSERQRENITDIIPHAGT